MYYNWGYNKKYFKQHCVSDEIGVPSSGYIMIDVNDFETFRKDGLLDYQILYVEEGVLNVRDNGETVRLLPGDIIFYKPNQAQNYFYKKEDATKACWIHFGGTLAQTLIERLDLSEIYIAHLDNGEFFSSYVRSIVDELKKQNFGFEEKVNGLLFMLLTDLSRELRNKEKSETETIIENICAKMKKEYNKHTTNEEYAEFCGFSLSYFLRIFKSTVGVPPQKYINDLRISAAKNLLRTSDYKIMDICEFVGFSDSLYFSRTFKKSTGLSPKEYRKKHKYSLSI